MRYTFFTLCILSFAYLAVGQTPEEQFKQLTTQLQKTPSDNILREKIIKLAPTINPPPVIPEEARRPFVRANTAIKDATSPEDYAQAIKFYNDALLLAPWWADAYYNLAKGQELHQDYEAAIQSLKFFLMTSPPSADARTVQDQIYVLEEKRDKKALADKAKADAENARAEAEKAAASKKEGLAKFKALVGQRTLWKYDGSLVDPMSDIFESAKRGLTLSELSGHVFWHVNVDSGFNPFYKFDEDKVELYAVTRGTGNLINFPIFRGIPNGSNLSDMVWTMVDGMGHFLGPLKNVGDTVWFDIDETTGRLMLSDNRPLTNPDPKARYRYIMYKPQ